MASLHKDPHGRSPYFYCAFSLPNGARRFKSTKQTSRKEAWRVCLQWEKASEAAGKGSFTEVQARKVLNEILQSAGEGPIRPKTVREFFTNWLAGKELAKKKDTFRLRGRTRQHQALLPELAAFNSGLCLITTRTPVADIADHERTSALRRDLEQLSSDAGAELLRALGVKGDEAELRTASDEFSGHCLALTLLGSYLTDAYHGDIHCRSEVSGHLARALRQGVHARKVMESYQTWLGEGPEVAVLRMLGLFDRPADEKALGALLKSPAIPGLTESLTDLSPTEWRTILQG